MTMRAILKRMVGLVLRDYEVYKLYHFYPGSSPVAAPPSRFVVRQVSGSEVLASEYPCVRKWAEDDDGAHILFGCWLADTLVGVCSYGLKPADMWTRLEPHEAILAIAETAIPHRSTGVARALIYQSAQEMYARGYQRLLGSIWFSNYPSHRATAAAGWQVFGWHLALRVRFGFQICITRRESGKEVWSFGRVQTRAELISSNISSNEYKVGS